MTYTEILQRLHLLETSRRTLIANNLYKHPKLVNEFLNAVGYGIYLVQEAGVGKVAGVLDGGLVNPLEECTSVSVLTDRALEPEDIEIESSIWEELPMGFTYEEMQKGPGGYVYLIVENCWHLTTDQKETLKLLEGLNRVLIWSKRKGLCDGME